MTIAKILLPVIVLVLTSAPLRAGDRMQEALAATHRAAADTARDRYRHPEKTLQFFGITPQMTVVEIWPGGGWYTDILAAYLDGTLYAAHFNPASGVNYFRSSLDRFRQKLAARPDVYGKVELCVFDPDNERLDVDDAGADAVVTFRNVHNWLRGKSEAQAFEQFFRVLKPGGVLGVVEHRAKPETDWNDMRDSGYMTEAYVIGLAERAGFTLEARSEVNANPADNKDHPKGVWTLPPSLRLGDQDRDKYLAIGESDRMTLRFRKPSP